MLSELLASKITKGKEKTETISKWLIDKKISLDELIAFATALKKMQTKQPVLKPLSLQQKNPSIATENCLLFVSKALAEKAPRIKWESAKVIGNIAHQFPAKLEGAIKNLLVNTEHEGTVVRWSAAFGLGEILKLKTRYNKNLLRQLIPSFSVKRKTASGKFIWKQ